MIKVKCPNAACGKLCAVKEEYAGKRAKCPACGAIMVIPNIADAPPAASAVRAPASRPTAPPPSAVEEYEAYEDEPRGPTAKSGQVTAIAIVNFVLGGLSILGGLCLTLGGLIFGGLAVAKPTISTKGMSPEATEKIAKEFAKASAAMGGGAAWIATALVIMGVLSLLWGAAAIADGVGVLNRRNWGRVLALVLGGVAGVLGVVSLALGFMGGDASSFVSAVLYIAYAAWVCLVMTRTSVVREFSQNPVSRGV